MTTTPQLGSGDWAILAAGAALLIAGGARYAYQPSFWLDEAFVAASLRNPSPHTIFARLEYGQHYPRIYLLCIALLRQAAGYHIWVLRLPPFVFWPKFIAPISSRAFGVWFRACRFRNCGHPTSRR